MIAPAFCIIPAYQASATLGAVVAGLRSSLPEALVLAVDDGSTDGTGETARACCDEVIEFPLNRGKGAALRAGVERALRRGTQGVVTIDADGQHDPSAAGRLLGALEEADLAIGVRERNGSGMPLARRITNGASSLAMSACARTSLRDPQSGYRAYRRVVLERVRGVGERYDYESDLLLRALRAGYRVAQLSVPTIYGAPSHFLPIADGMRVVRTIWRHRAGVLPVRLSGAGAGEGRSTPLPEGYAS